MITRELVEFALELVNGYAGHPWQLHQIPARLRTYEVCMAAVARDGFQLKLVPASLRTYEMYVAAVKASPSALRMVPKKHRTVDLCMYAAVQNRLLFTHHREWSFELGVALFRLDRRSLDNFPIEWRRPVVNYENTYIMLLANARRIRPRIPSELWKIIWCNFVVGCDA